MRLPEKIKHTASRYPDCGAVSDSNLLPPEIYQKIQKLARDKNLKKKFHYPTTHANKITKMETFLVL
jgi:hypothetical protein